MSQASVPNSSYIQSSRVSGTEVYNPQGERLGVIEDIVLTKVEGQAVYAVLSFGGLFGVGDRHHPLPWSVLTYDTGLGGYVVNLTREQIEGAPSHGRGEAPDWDDPDFGGRVAAHYGPLTADPSLSGRIVS